jgi:hypothetical protein
VPYSDLHTLDVQGYTKTKGGNVFGGGFGAKGALEGMAAATILNALTTTSTRWVVITIIGPGGSIVLRKDGEVSGVVRQRLRTARDTILSVPSFSQPTQSHDQNELVSGLERLAKMLEE